MNPPLSRSDRKCTKDWTDEVTGMTIKKGTLIRIPTYTIHHCEEYWPEPELFKPERFLKENSGDIIPYTYLPFGAGPRVCIGEKYLIELLLTYML